MIDELTTFRQQKDAFFKHQPQSPLTSEQQAKFDGLSYYPYNPDLDLTVTVKPFAQQDLLIMQTTTGDEQHYTRYGNFVFAVDDQEVQLTIYAADYGFFLPFADSNAGNETYGAGRYLEPEQVGESNIFHVNFNLAYNPYCAYNERWSCPITPSENRLKVPVRAGEKIPAGEWARQA